MKSEYHEIGIVLVLFVERGINKQEKKTKQHFQLFIFLCRREKENATNPQLRWPMLCRLSFLYH